MNVCKLNEKGQIENIAVFDDGAYDIANELGYTVESNPEYGIGDYYVDGAWYKRDDYETDYEIPDFNARALSKTNPTEFITAKLFSMVSPDLTDEEVLSIPSMYPRWEAGKHTKGEIFTTSSTDVEDAETPEEWEQIWECYQDYDNAVYPDIAPGLSAWFTFNRPLHGKSKSTARPYVPSKAGAEGRYLKGEWIFYKGWLHECVAENGTVYSPDEYAQDWRKDSRLR